MKVILLAAGRSKRLKPLEDKNFLEFLGKPLIQYQLEQLIASGLKDILLIGGRHNLDRLKKVAAGFRAKIQVAEQKNLDDGMAGAILSAEKFVKNEPVLIVSANDIVDKKAYEMMLKNSRDARFDSYILAKKVTKYFPGGYLKTKSNGLLTGIVEKPGAGREPGDLVNLVVHFHRESKELINILKKTNSKKDDRYEVTLDTLMKKGTKMKVVPYQDFWQPIKYPWDVLTVMDFFLMSLPKISRRKGVKIAPSATIRGNVLLEEGVSVLENAVIIGPAYIGKNTVIASNTLVRNSMVGSDCVIGFGTEVARSYLGNQVWTHKNYIGDSVIGNDCSFGGGTVTGNLRLDEGNISLIIQGEKVDSGRQKFGIVTGEHVRCGINTSFMPGVRIGNNSFIGAGIVVSQDVPDQQFVYAKTELIMKENKHSLSVSAREKLKKML
jgi:NDP-sugar pyrophosphorylase family protein